MYGSYCKVIPSLYSRNSCDRITTEATFCLNTGFMLVCWSIISWWISLDGNTSLLKWDTKIWLAIFHGESNKPITYITNEKMRVIGTKLDVQKHAIFLLLLLLIHYFCCCSTVATVKFPRHDSFFSVPWLSSLWNFWLALFPFFSDAWLLQFWNFIACVCCTTFRN